MSGATGATATTVHPADKAPYGAVGDGVTDDYAAIQRDINDTAAAGGGIVTLPAGTFVINGHLVMKSNVELRGAGDAASATPTVIRAGPNFLGTTGPQGGYPVVTTSGAANVTIADLVADQQGGALREPESERLSAYLIDLRASTNVLVDHVSTRNPGSYSIAAVGSSHFCIRYSDTQVDTSGVYSTPGNSGQLDGIHVLDSSFGDVDANNVDQRYNENTDGDDGLVAHTINATTHDISYLDNKVRGGSGGDGLQLAVGNFAVYNITIENNEFYGSPEGIRTGYYDSGTGAVHNVIASDNHVHDLMPGIAFPTGGDAVWFFGSGKNGGISSFTVTANTYCHAGGIVVDSGPGVVVSNNTLC